MTKGRTNSSGPDFLTCPLPVDDLSDRRFAIQVGGRGWGGLAGGLKASVKAVCEVGVLLQVSVARAHMWHQ